MFYKELYEYLNSKVYQSEFYPEETNVESLLLVLPDSSSDGVLSIELFQPNLNQVLVQLKSYFPIEELYKSVELAWPVVNVINEAIPLGTAVLITDQIGLKYNFLLPNQEFDKIIGELGSVLSVLVDECKSIQNLLTDLNGLNLKSDSEQIITVLNKWSQEVMSGSI